MIEIVSEVNFEMVSDPLCIQKQTVIVESNAMTLTKGDIVKSVRGMYRSNLL